MKNALLIATGMIIGSLFTFFYMTDPVKKVEKPVAPNILILPSGDSLVLDTVYNTEVNKFVDSAVQRGWPAEKITIIKPVKQ